jgi:hypothetical protein
MLPAQGMQVKKVSLVITDQVENMLNTRFSLLLYLRLLCTGTDNDADNDVSDVASLASASAHTSTSTPASTASTTASSPRMAMGQGMQPPVLANPVAPAIPNAARRALARGRVDEVSGEGSQSEGLDSPT